MRSTLVTLGVIVISLASSSIAVAQTDSSTQETRRIAYQFGACAVRNHATTASKAVLSNVDSLTLRTRYDALLDSHCLSRSNRLEFPGDFYVYTLADALVARELTAAPIPDLTNVPALARRPKTSFAELKARFGYDAALGETTHAPIYEALNEYGECVVRQSPANAKALLMTQPESAAEASRFDALQPALSACAPEGTMELTKLLVRGTVAFNYYRLAQSALHVPIH